MVGQEFCKFLALRNHIKGFLMEFFFHLTWQVIPKCEKLLLKKKKSHTNIWYTFSEKALIWRVFPCCLNGHANLHRSIVHLEVIHSKMWKPTSELRARHSNKPKLSGHQSVSSVAQLCLTLCNLVDCRTPGLPVHHQLLELTQNHVHQVSDPIQPSHPLSSLSPPAFNLSQNQGLSNELVLYIRWPKYWNFSFSISPSNEYSGLISFSMDWLHLTAVQGTLKSLPQHHSSKASILQCSAFLWSNSHVHTWLLEKP